MAEPLTDPRLAAIRARSAAEDVTHEGRRFLPGAQLDRRALLAEVDRLRETLARVRALADNWAALPPGTYRRAGKRVLAALDGTDTPEEQTDGQ